MIVSLRTLRPAFVSLAVLAALSAPALADYPPYREARGYYPPPSFAPRFHPREAPVDLAWARDDPSATEIRDGRPLNLLLRSAANERLERAPTILLDKDTLKGINVRPAGSTGDLGLLKNGGKLSWPLGLQEPEYDLARKSIDSNIAVAVDALSYGKTPEASVLKDLEADEQTLQTTLDANIHRLTPTDYIASERYLKQLENAIRTLEDPAATTYFDRSWTSGILTVGDLAEYMTRKGLEFAPAAAPGDDACYTSLYHSLRQFDLAVCR